MINQLSVLGIVPARGGSKGLPGKNIRPLCGKPLLAWSVECGRASRYVDSVLVTTDSPQIAEAGRAAGAVVPFLRPAELSSDTASSIDVLLHCIDQFQPMGRPFNLIVLLEPTSPLREYQDIDHALEMLVNTPTAESVVSVCQSEGGHPAFLYSLASDNRLRPFSEESGRHVRRQDISPVFFPEGTIYATRAESLRQRRTFYHERTFALTVPRWKSVEIDDIYDLVHAEAIMKYHLSLPKSS